MIGGERFGHIDKGDDKQDEERQERAVMRALILGGVPDVPDLRYSLSPFSPTTPEETRVNQESKGHTRDNSNGTGCTRTSCNNKNKTPKRSKLRGPPRIRRLRIGSKGDYDSSLLKAPIEKKRQQQQNQFWPASFASPFSEGVELRKTSSLNFLFSRR